MIQENRCEASIPLRRHLRPAEQAYKRYRQRVPVIGINRVALVNVRITIIYIDRTLTTQLEVPSLSEEIRSTWQPSLVRLSTPGGGPTTKKLFNSP
jgi:hypothetical protein